LRHASLRRKSPDFSWRRLASSKASIVVRRGNSPIATVQQPTTRVPRAAYSGMTCSPNHAVSAPRLVVSGVV